VRRLAEQHDLGIGETVEQAPEGLVIGIGDLLGGSLEDLDRLREIVLAAALPEEKLGISPLQHGPPEVRLTAWRRGGFLDEGGFCAADPTRTPNR
jgi:hypothetical protein